VTYPAVYPEELVITLKKAREKAGLRQRELAEKVGVPQSHISKIETGKISPTISILIQIARILRFELMAVPKQYTGLVKSLTNNDPNAFTQPAYRIDEDD